MKHKLIYSCLILFVIAALASCQNSIQTNTSISDQYFPNKVGDSWTYMVNDTVGENLQVSIMGTTHYSDGTPATIWKWIWPENMNQKAFGTDTTYVIVKGDSILISPYLHVYSNGTKLIDHIYIFPLQAGQVWRHDADSSQVVSEDSLTVPAGSFGGVYRIHTTGGGPNYFLDRNIWFKPGVGIIQMYQKRFYGGFYGTLKLVDYHVK